VIVPTLVIAGLVGVYSATTLLWPLHAVAPTVAAIEVQPIAAPATTPVWPVDGSAAIGVGGIAGTPASAVEPDAIASITKVVTALVVLDEMPLAVGEQGPEFRFTAADRNRYWQYRSNGESALDVPVGGALTEYQMLEGMLIGSANNYADRLAQNLWPNDAVFASAANRWLSTHGVPGVTIVEPTGMDGGNAATPEALIALAQKALANPVVAEIVAKQSVELPGAGLVENTNGLLADPGVVGIKTGTLDAWNLLSAKDITVGDTTVRVFASVLGQPDDEARLAASRALYTQLEQELQLKPSVTSGTIAATVETLWGDPVDIVTTTDAAVVLWNGGSGTVGTSFALDENRDEGDTVGSLTVTGPLDAATVDLQLADDIQDPSPWWRLTHPLDLFGLNG
jgi:D-alanyl-D-alanine carboxypeptidase (penicillin-binding protein 5/6)